ncbi:MAG: hypothetical protein KIS92_23940 [Planctomycetota bacterium]|nr:hypothetical protein [Planctomycetota bacterium]
MAKKPARRTPSHTSRKRKKPSKRAPPSPVSATLDAKVQTQALVNKIAEFRHRHPALMARLSLLTILLELQDVLGGEFPEHIAFIHMADWVINVRRVGHVDIDNMIVGIEVYEMGDIRPGILWVPLDHILWVGTTNEPIGAEKIGLEARSVSSYSPQRGRYERARRGLAGLLKPEPATTTPPPPEGTPPA